MISVEVRNFQSIEHASFQIEGFTALVGRSNIGKSAFIRAVKCALTGAPVASFVRHGRACARKVKNQKTCRCFVSVRIKSAEFDLLWEKGDAVNRYVWNGAEYPAAERGMPDFLLASFNEVDVGDKSVILQIADQFSPIFLLDQSPTTVADVLSDMAKLDQVNVAMRMAERDRREAVSVRKVREKDLIDAKIRLAGYEGLDVLALDVRSIKGKLETIHQGQAKVGLIEKFIRTKLALDSQVDRLAGVSSLRAPDPNHIRRYRDKYLSLQGMCARAKDRTVMLESLRGVQTITVPSLSPLRDRAGVANRLHGWLDRLHNFRSSLARFNSLPSLDLPKTLPLEASTKFRHLHALLGRFKTLVQTLADLEAEYKTAIDEEASVMREWDALGVCSTCARPFHFDSHTTKV